MRATYANSAVGDCHCICLKAHGILEAVPVILFQTFQVLHVQYNLSSAFWYVGAELQGVNILSNSLMKIFKCFSLNLKNCEFTLLEVTMNIVVFCSIILQFIYIQLQLQLQLLIQMQAKSMCYKLSKTFISICTTDLTSCYAAQVY